MVKRSPTLGALVSTKTKCIKVIFIGKITLVPVAFLMASSIHVPCKDYCSTDSIHCLSLWQAFGVSMIIKIVLEQKKGGGG